MRHAKITEVAASAVAGLAIDEFQYYTDITNNDGTKTTVPQGGPIYYVRFIEGGGYSGQRLNITSPQGALDIMNVWHKNALAKQDAARRLDETHEEERERAQATFDAAAAVVDDTMEGLARDETTKAEILAAAQATEVSEAELDMLPLGAEAAARPRRPGMP